MLNAISTLKQEMSYEQLLGNVAPTLHFSLICQIMFCVKLNELLLKRLYYMIWFKMMY